ncbi:hypothetical protein [Streptomyces sp. NPDC001389]|uniref:hypothetical protein n=1 Tax=unclassified Streptomyces TaxID=2593676 RepID=UPI0036780193
MATRLARRAVERAAPHELPQFEMTALAFHDAPGHRRLGGGARRGEALGLGLETAAALLGTVALTAAVQVLDRLSQQAADQVADTARQGLRGWFRRRRREPGAQPSPVLPSREPLSAHQLAELRHVAYDTALRLRVPEPAAQAIADGIVAELATLTAVPAEGPGPAEGAPGPADAAG